MRGVLLILFSMVAIVASAFDVPEESAVLAGYDEATVRARFKGNATKTLEGLWYYPDERLTLVVERHDAERGSRAEVYRLVVVDSEDTAINPGTVAGYAERAARPDQLRLRLYSAVVDERLTMPIECLATVDDDCNSIMVEKPKLKVHWSVNLARFLPSIFDGIRIYPHVETPKAAAGFVRLEQLNTKNPIYF